jgi:membrane-bound ClpP family serine protease
LCFSHHLGICSNTLFVVELRGAMNLPAANCVRRALRDAEERRTGLVVIEMHMPGGLDPSMRKIIQDVSSSPVPLAVSLEGLSFFSLPPWITSPAGLAN